MASTRKTALLENQSRLATDGVEVPVTGVGRGGRPPVSGRPPVDRVEPERAADDVVVEEGRDDYAYSAPRGNPPSEHSRSMLRSHSRADTMRSLDRQRRIKELEDALKQRDDELEDMRRMLFDRGIHDADRSKRKFDGPSGSSKKKVSREESSKSVKPWCSSCLNCHHGSCTADTIRCRNCNKIGHSSMTCKNPSVCYNCKEAGHISRDCLKEKKGLSCFSCGEVGHVSLDCPRNTDGKRVDAPKP